MATRLDALSFYAANKFWSQSYEALFAMVEQGQINSQLSMEHNSDEAALESVAPFLKIVSWFANM